MKLWGAFALFFATFATYAFNLWPAEMFGEPQSFIPHSSYLAMSIDDQAMKPYRQSVRFRLSERLKVRGESHITVITPPELKELLSHLSMEEIEQIALQHKIQDSDISITCLGMAEVQKQQTYFLVAQSENLQTIRQAIYQAHNNRIGLPAASVPHFYPHITVGFTHRDLHISDGVKKDRRHCLAEL